MPSGYLDHFLTLEPHVRAAAERADRLNGKITNLSAAEWLHNQKQHRAEEAKIERTAMDQLVLASELKPKRFRTRWQAMSFQGPTARQDAETVERNKCRFLGASRRAGTVRARVRSIRKFLAWLAGAHELPYPTSHMHFVEFLQVRHSEPGPREAIKLTHAASVFMEELSGVKEKLTVVPL